MTTPQKNNEAASFVSARCRLLGTKRACHRNRVQLSRFSFLLAFTETLVFQISLSLPPILPGKWR